MHILMVDYNGTCNEEGEALGHSPKVLHEYAGLLNGFAVVDALLSPCVAEKVVKEDFKNVYKLRYNLIQGRNNSIVKRIIDKYYLFYNLSKVFRQRDYDIILFYKMDFFLAVYLFLFGLWKKNRSTKYIGLIYQQKFEVPFASLVNYIYQKGIQRLDGLIHTLELNELNHKNKMYMPDYYYVPETYDKYKKIEKQEKVVCVGTMNYYKELDKLVECFNMGTYPLEICGYFMDKEMLIRLQKKANKNIQIHDCVLSQEEYYTLIGEAKYSILPYNMQQYKERTSGVLYETVFLGSIPIAPKGLLEYNHVSGIAYDSWEELQEWIKDGVKKESGLWMQEQKKVVYSSEEIQRNLEQFLGEI